MLAERRKGLIDHGGIKDRLGQPAADRPRYPRDHFSQENKILPAVADSSSEVFRKKKGISIPT